MFNLRTCFYFLLIICSCLCYTYRASSCSTPTIVIHNIAGPLNDTVPAADSLSDRVFEATEFPATPDTAAWRRHLQMGLRDVIVNAARSGMKIGKYTIHVRFVVEKDGSITNVQALDDPGYGTKRSVEKIISKGPKWRPAEIAGQKVRSYRTQPVTFMILSNFN
jgi:hypothetical protein